MFKKFFDTMYFIVSKASNVSIISAIFFTGLAFILDFISRILKKTY